MKKEKGGKKKKKKTKQKKEVFLGRRGCYCNGSPAWRPLGRCRSCAARWGRSRRRAAGGDDEEDGKSNQQKREESCCSFPSFPFFSFFFIHFSYFLSLLTCCQLKIPGCCSAKAECLRWKCTVLSSGITVNKPISPGTRTTCGLLLLLLLLSTENKQINKYMTIKYVNTFNGGLVIFYSL